MLRQLIEQLQAIRDVERHAEPSAGLTRPPLPTWPTSRQELLEACVGALDAWSPHYRREALLLLGFFEPTPALTALLRRQLADPDDACQLLTAVLLGSDDPFAAPLIPCPYEDEQAWEHAVSLALDHVSPRVAPNVLELADYSGKDYHEPAAAWARGVGAEQAICDMAHGMGLLAESCMETWPTCLSDATVAELPEALNSAEEYVFISFLKAAAKRPHPAMIPTLVEDGTNNSDELGEQGVTALARLAANPATRASIVDLTQSSRPHDRFVAALALRAAGDAGQDAILEAYTLVDGEDHNNLDPDDVECLIDFARHLSKTDLSPIPSRPFGTIAAWWKALPEGDASPSSLTEDQPTPWVVPDTRAPTPPDLDAAAEDASHQRREDAIWDALPVMGHVLGVPVLWTWPLVDQGHATLLTYMQEDTVQHAHDTGWFDDPGISTPDDDLPDYRKTPFLTEEGTIHPKWQVGLLRASCRYAHDRWPPNDEVSRWISWLFFEKAGPAGAIDEALRSAPATPAEPVSTD